jgi:hypothetical protein
MVDLFRYIEHDFAVPAAADAIDVANDSDFQSSLGEAATPAGDGGPRAAGEPTAAQAVRSLSEAYLAEHFPSPTADPTALGDRLEALTAALGALDRVTSAAVEDAVVEAFGGSSEQVVIGDDFAADRALLENSVVAVKLSTGFDRADAARLVRQLRAMALLERLAADSTASLDRASLTGLLGRPVRVPPTLLAVLSDTSTTPVPDAPPDDGHRERIVGMQADRDRVLSGYTALLAVAPQYLEMTTVGPDDAAEARDAPPAPAPEADRALAHGESGATAEPVPEDATTAPQAILTLGPAARDRFVGQHAEALDSLGLDLSAVPLDLAVGAFEARLTELNTELLPLEVPTEAKVFRVGGHLFSEPMTSMKALDAPGPGGPGAPQVPGVSPDFGKAITRPVGIGNLQVVRQELVGYRAGEISHIENVLPGEALRRDTSREQINETILTEETATTAAQERDQQSTDRNELATETQKESGRQSSTSGPGMSSSDYGRLVENSKSNFAQTVVARSVESLTQQVRRQQVQRERITYTERARHDLDNSAGAKQIVGIYQWLDKKYSMRVLNYGRRLLYDVVVPEPAAFLVQALRDAVQPESFDLVKPLDPNLLPETLNVSNYTWYASRYGVSGAVAPPPEIYTRTVSHTEAPDPSVHLTVYGQQTDVAYHSAFKITVPEGYKAVSGYVQQVNVDERGAAPGATLELVVANYVRARLMSAENPHISASFTMSGETGDVPMTVRTFREIVSLAFAVALVCQRTDSAYAQWQLRTHAAIVAGYQRQLATYEDRLTRYVASVRAQLAAAGNFAHDPSVTRDELKRAFIGLLLGEHPAARLATPVPAPMPPAATLPDPVAVKAWGAMVAFFERAFEWENLMFTCYPYYWGRPQRWEEMVLTQDLDPQFEEFLKAGAVRVVVPARPGFEAALAHYQETGDVWMGEEIPDMYGDNYLSIIAEIKAANVAPGDEVCLEQWEVTLPTTLVLLKDDATLPEWAATPCAPAAQP